jgi:beta-lactamase regulating signal transducer with metallopeptidase domain/HEAT repeat protein
MSAMQALGWALVHSLWQSALAAAWLAALLAIIPVRAARTRYALAVMALVLTLALPFGTALRLGGAASRPAERESVTSIVSPAPVAPVPGAAVADQRYGGHEAAPPPPAAPPLAVRVHAALEPALPWLVALWLGGVLALSLRLVSGWLTARRLGTVGTRPAPEACFEALARLAARLRVTRPVRVLESAVVQVPAVIGWLRPVILLPASALTGLTPLQLDALLAHELAHVRRYDYLVNLFQTVIETLLFYHPAVWWVSRQVRQEREHCCDDLAIAVCGDAHFYASALLGMERLRGGAPAFAFAATGGSLMKRIQRLVAPAKAEIFPRWAAGLVAATLVLAVGGVGLTGATAGPNQSGGGVAPLVPSDATGAAPDTVLRHPDPTRPLAERWEWARAQARRWDGRRFWIGYSVRPSATLADAVYVDREPDVPGLGNGLVLRGVRLAQLVGDGADPNDVVLLFRFAASGRPMLERVQVSSFFLPVQFGGGALLWLGAADDGASLARLQTSFAEAPTPDLKEDIVAAAGMHGSDAVRPLLERWLTGDEPPSVRAQAAEWLGQNRDSAAVRVLARAARRDPASHVRREAAEALGHDPSPASTDSLIALARSLPDAHARREAVEGLRHKSDPRVVATLIAIARDDGDEDVQREAVETLSELPDGAGRAALVDVLRTHPNPDVRREAVKELGESLPSAETIRVLSGVVRQDRDVDVQREAIETLGNMKDGAALRVVIEFARTHPDPDVRSEAIDVLEDAAPPDVALELLQDIARRDRVSDVQKEAVEGLGKVRDDRALALLVEFARHHPVSKVRREALETLRESDDPRARALLEQALGSVP